MSTEETGQIIEKHSANSTQIACLDMRLKEIADLWSQVLDGLRATPPAMPRSGPEKELPISVQDVYQLVSRRDQLITDRQDIETQMCRMGLGEYVRKIT